MASSLTPALRRMRIIALPLTRKSATHDALTYYQFVTRAPDGDQTKQPNLAKRAQHKAADIWAGFGKAEGGWKLKTFQTGQKLVDRIDFEELALSGLDPSLGPKISKFGKPALGKMNENADEETPLTEATPIALIHPAGLEPRDPVAHLHAMLSTRKPRHRKGMWTWAAIAPLTAPFAILPVIPNLPFFFCVWRAWTHYRAFKASEYLDSLLQRGAIAAEANAELDKIYARYAARSSRALPADEKAAEKAHPDEGAAENDDPVLLTRDAVPDIVSLFQLPDDAAAGMYRALEQAAQRTAPSQSRTS